jgi:hypothetical protein
MKIKENLSPAELAKKLQRLWQLSTEKVWLIDKEYDPAKGSPVFTVKGKYTTRGWTEWTQGFQFGNAILTYDATDDAALLDYGRKKTVEVMYPHLTHVGVHDHGFNNVSTYGNLRRLMNEGRIPENEWERHFYEVALKNTGAVQARRWTRRADGGGFIYSFNGPHSLFVDTIRSCRALTLGHKLGSVLMEEHDEAINLLHRAIEHARSTALYNVFYDEGRDSYETWGRTCHEAIFNTNDGNFRCPNAQQGFSGFTTWTRGLSWAMAGFPEELEFLRDCVSDEELEPVGGRAAVESFMLKAAKATCDFFIDQGTASDGVTYWDTGAPQIHKLGNWQSNPADPFNAHEPVDSTAAAIGAQGLLRLGKYLESKGDNQAARRYWQAGLTTMDTLLDEPYLSTAADHQGLLLHSIYHRPNGWDYIPEGQLVPCGESSMWGDYHYIEAAIYLQREIDGKPYYTFYA